MSHHHHHHHDHSITITNVNRAFIIGITLNFLFVVIEVIAGLYIDSLSLLSDAGHNLADVATLALSLLAFRLLKVKSNEHYTYGYRKTSILVALFNGVVLLVSIGAIVFEAIQRFLHPVAMPGITIAWIACIGIVINAITALLFFKGKEKDLNQKSAYLHLMSDALVSLAIAIGGVIIFYTKLYWIDSLLSILVALVILISTWKLLKDSLRLSLDGVPEGIHIEDIRKAIAKMPGIQNIHHIHIWAISTTENALTAHLVLEKDTSIEQEQKIKHEVRHELEHLNIHHVTLETEWGNEECGEKTC